MPDGLRQRWPWPAHERGEAAEREPLRQREVGDAVLVMNGQGLGRLAHDRRRAAAHLRQLTPR